MKKTTYQPIKSGFLDVSDGYKLYYEQYGNPDGKPVLFLHGGPGGSGSGGEIYNIDFFDQAKWNIITFDQRGAGKSTPFASLHENTTPKLLQDIDKILDLFSLDKIFLHGGSWGSTLSLIYAIQNPERITGMLVRGIYLGSSNDNQHLIDGPIQYNFPENFERFMSFVPKEKQHDVIGYYLNKMLHGTEEEKEKYCYEFDYFESAFLAMQVTQEEIEEGMEDGSYRSFAPIEATYMMNTCFVPDNYILDYAAKLSSIPTTIIHGRYDFVCPPSNAWQLHKKIQGSKLRYVFAGHSAREKDMQDAITEELALFVK